MRLLRSIPSILVLLQFSWIPKPVCANDPKELFNQYCIDCHEGSHAEGNLDLSTLIENRTFDATLIFENIATGKMPPADADSPHDAERRKMLNWLAGHQTGSKRTTFRRLSRHEFVHSVNDLLETNLNLAETIPDDRGTWNFTSDRRIQLSREVLSSYFAVADTILDSALPPSGFPNEQTWVTNELKDSHETYNIYVRDYKDGILFSWTRANNGNSYSFFYDNFDPPVSGWYDLTLEAAKVGNFDEHVSIQVHTGKYYYADDRPQPQRLLDVISLGNRELKTYSIRAFLNPGESVSVHCHSKHNWRQKSPTEGAYIRQLRAYGPVQDQLPRRYAKLFGDAPLQSEPKRERRTIGNPDVAVPISHEDTRRKATDPISPDTLKDVIKRFAQRAFSTQLTETELEPYFNLVQREYSEHSDFVGATKVGFKAVTCSLRFLMAPGEHSSPAHSQAASLARTLWLSVPDTELLNVAANADSAALSVEVLRSQIHRMLADKRGDRMIKSLCDQWLNLRSWNKVAPSLKLYPNYDDLLHHYLPLETQAYLSYLIRENMPVGHLIDSDYSFLNQRLAQHYEVNGVIGQRLRRVSFGPDVPRGGLLTMGSVLKVTTDGFDTSPILRGAWVSKNIVGTPISPPPDTVQAIESEHGNSAKTVRDQIEQHKNNATCYACHKSIDPYGFALESFDATGQWRKTYRVKKPHSGTFQFRREGYFSEGDDVDSSGNVSDRRFDDVLGLKKLLLADHRRVGYNFAKKFFEYANGYAPSLKQRLVLLAMLDDESDSCRMKDVVTDVMVYSLSEKAP